MACCRPHQTALWEEKANNKREHTVLLPFKCPNCRCQCVLELILISYSKHLVFHGLAPEIISLISYFLLINLHAG